jgi:HTH-type transcriptional regulator / antitoxin HipB
VLGRHHAREGCGEGHDPYHIDSTLLGQAKKLAEDPDLLLSQIGLRILRRRQELGLSQKDLGDRLGIAQTNVARIEHGQQNLTVRTLVKLAEALGVTAAELFAGTALPDARG